MRAHAPTRRNALAPLLGLGLACAASNPAPTGPSQSPASSSTSIPAPTITTPTITPLVHASLLLRVGESSIYVDPWSKAEFTGLPKADVILVTDVHPDHLDPAAIEAIRQEDTLILGPEAVAERLPGVTVIRSGERREVDRVPGMRVEAVPMYNLRRGPEEGKLFHDKGRGNGYVVSVGGQRIYISGDTECTEEMRALADIDVALVCMNLPYTMPPSEAIECVRAFRPRVVIPYHYRGSDPGEVARAFADDPAIEVRLHDWYPAGG